MAYRSDLNASFLRIRVPISRFLVSLLKSGVEHRMWGAADNHLCIVYRDPSGHVIAVTEDWDHPGTTLVYRGSEVGGLTPRRVGAWWGRLCECNDPGCYLRHERKVSAG